MSELAQSLVIELRSWWPIQLGFLLISLEAGMVVLGDDHTLLALARCTLSAQ